MAKVAVVQTSPVLLNREQTIQLAANLTDEAAGQGAELVFLPRLSFLDTRFGCGGFDRGGIGGLPRKFTLDC
jgi:predicted amidohydrolase